MPACPSCSKELDTEAGVKIHHYNKHGESIAIEESECRRCNKVFEYYPSDKEGIFCPECADNSWGNENLIIGGGEDNPRWRGGPIETLCAWCDKDIKVRRYNYEEYENNFCSKECEGKLRSEDFSGDGNPRYIDGRHRDRDYGTQWKIAREQALERDGRKCVVCDNGKEELGREPSVHHEIPVRVFDNSDDAHYLENLVTVCPKHHQKKEIESRKI